MILKVLKIFERTLAEWETIKSEKTYRKNELLTINRFPMSRIELSCGKYNVKNTNNNVLASLRADLFEAKPYSCRICSLKIFHCF